MKNDLMKMVLKAHRKSFQIAFETAVRTRTALVFMENGKLVKITPPTVMSWFLLKRSRKTRNSHPCGMVLISQTCYNRGYAHEK